ncbi:MAG: nitrous oxide reductase accessory protein NosL [Saprospiraceae bacterium]|nr:nitrous oxide reductase accessory protein NosL [Saprospiraceae bacterium]
MRISIILFLLLINSLFSCNVSPVPIEYNHDECAYCKMKIANVQFGAELVTSKGKVFKFDSAECLVWEFIKDEAKEYAFVLVTDHSRPHNFIDAESSSFLISENQPSPMGGNLSAYESVNNAQNVMAQKGGKIMKWNDLLKEYKTLYK